MTIAGAMLAVAGASASELGEKRGCAVASGITRGGFVAPNMPVLDDKGRIATTVQFSEPAAAHACRGPRAAAGIHCSPTLPALTPGATHPVAASPRAAAAVRLVSRPRVRVTRLENGSILCCRERPPAHVVAVPSDANDDTASDGDDTSDDDDDLWDEVSGDDDTDSPIIAWLQALVVSYVALDGPRAMSWIIPASFPPFLTFQPLRC